MAQVVFPVARARFGDHITIGAFPSPHVKQVPPSCRICCQGALGRLARMPRLLLAPFRLEGQWRIPATSMCLTARYACPLDSLDRAWQPPARLMVRVDHQLGKGVQVSPFGIDFDEKVRGDGHSCSGSRPKRRSMIFRSLSSSSPSPDRRI